MQGRVCHDRQKLEAGQIMLIRHRHARAGESVCIRGDLGDVVPACDDPVTAVVPSPEDVRDTYLMQLAVSSEVVGLAVSRIEDIEVMNERGGNMRGHFWIVILGGH